MVFSPFGHWPTKLSWKTMLNVTLDPNHCNNCSISTSGAYYQAVTDNTITLPKIDSLVGTMKYVYRGR